MRKKTVPKSIIVEIVIKSVPDRLFQKLGDKACREADASVQIPELPGISLENITPFSGKEEKQLKRAEEWFRRKIKRIKPTRIIFQKIRRRKKEKGEADHADKIGRI